MTTVRIGIIGLGTIGRQYFEEIQAGLVEDAIVTAVTIRDETVVKAQQAVFPDLKIYLTAEALCASSEVDAVLIATPHMTHVALAKLALRQGKHVFVEKPLGVKLADLLPLVSEVTQSDLIFSVQYQERVHPTFQAIKKLLAYQEIGEIQRIHWQILQYYRDAAYYNDTAWRGTWALDGGGVLLNQTIHQLDLWQYLFGMPSRIFANCRFGAYRQIEVEDEVTATFVYPNGSQGTFIASVNEPFSQDRLEIIGEKGTIVLDGLGKIWLTTALGCREIPIVLEENQWSIDRDLLLADFVAHITGKSQEPLISDVFGATKSVELVNGMWLSTWQKSWVDLPLDMATFNKYYQINHDA
ncbi:oxidoreductase [Lactococcus hodotermopsidis]|uniref:Oxidoreductase n=1 Tax=Pseudolactococcus hodotermopsidis TaxID=2709157 RepID=A0A6A0BBI9_9LACT|nr:Gfo/Idh/MocA family oxidoreductase [Lactococcus hodotermopsidis]GFH42043.1 oxidoreductase [Lactococcus hodotermopsidis]